VFVQWLGPKSSAAWVEIEEMWATTTLHLSSQAIDASSGPGAAKGNVIADSCLHPGRFTAVERSAAVAMTDLTVLWNGR
jgi:hypothetical protein